MTNSHESGTTLPSAAAADGAPDAPRAAVPGRAGNRLGAWLVVVAVVVGALVVRPLLTPAIGSELSFILAYPATMIAAWYGGFWPGAVATVLLALLMPSMGGIPWDSTTVGRVGLYLPFGLLIAALCQSLHDTRTRLRRRADGLEATALSEERLSAALAAARMTVCELDRSLRYTWIKNPPFGLDAGRFLGKTPAEVFSPEEAVRFEAACRLVLAGGEPQRVDTRFSGPWGRRTMEHSIAASRNAEGSIAALRVVATDVTEIEAERERRRREQAVFRSALEQSLDPFEVLQPVIDGDRTVDFVWEYVNPAAAGFFGRKPEELIGRRLLAEPVDPFHAARFEHWVEVMAQGTPKRIEIGRGDNGSLGWYQLLSVSLGDRLAVTTHDATAQTRWLHAERAARSELQRAAKVKDEFLANLSHELRTPLNAIVGWAHLLGRAGADTALMQRAADAIGRNARAQAALVDDLLDMNSIVTGTLRLAHKYCDLSEIVLRAVNSVAPAAQAKWIRLDTTAVTPGLTCLGDPERLEQVFWNLVSNAVKYTPLNGAIHIALAQGDTGALAEIRDTGEGIEPEVLPDVFHRFRQADASMSRPHGGLGLGLTIVRSLVELHGGRVSIHSEGSGKGTRVFVELPLAEAPADASVAPAVPASGNALRMAHTQATPMTDSAPTQGDAAAAGALLDPKDAALQRAGAQMGTDTDSASRGPLSWRRILVLEDEADSLDLLSVLLRQQGAIVRAFDNAEQALAAAENASFDLVISDLGMPGMNGLEFMRRLKRRPLPVKAIALTAYAGEAQRAQALAAGFTRVEVKPIAPTRFLEIVLAEVGAPASAD
jgi:signal transduction histidine kinase